MRNSKLAKTLGFCLAACAAMPALAQGGGVACLPGSPNCQSQPVAAAATVTSASTCRACFFSQPDLKGNKWCLDTRTTASQPRWAETTRAPNLARSIDFEMQGCDKRFPEGWYLELVQGTRPYSTTQGKGPARLFIHVPTEQSDLRDLAKSHPGWSAFSFARFGETDSGESGWGPQPTAVETQLFTITEKTRSGRLFYPNSNPAAAPGAKRPTEGVAVLWKK